MRVHSHVHSRVHSRVHSHVHSHVLSHVHSHVHSCWLVKKEIAVGLGGPLGWARSLTAEPLCQQ